MDRIKETIDQSKDVRTVQYDPLTGEFSDSRIGKVLRTIAGEEKADFACRLGIKNWEETPGQTEPHFSEGRTPMNADTEKPAHDCDGADCCERAKQERAFSRVNVALRKNAERGLEESEKRAQHIEELNAHLREMLSLKGKQLVDANAKIEKLERLLGQKTCNVTE